MQIDEHALVDILWTVVPSAILVAMAVPATKSRCPARYRRRPTRPSRSRAISGNGSTQYLEDGISFVSNLNTLSEHIHDGAAKGEESPAGGRQPAGAAGKQEGPLPDHGGGWRRAWRVPQSAETGRDPRIVNEGWARIEKPGTYRGQCTELCGRGHGFMPIVVEARNERSTPSGSKDNERRKGPRREAATAETFTMEQLMEEGAKSYNASCAACHQAKGEGVPGAFPPLAGSAIAKGPGGRPYRHRAERKAQYRHAAVRRAAGRSAHRRGLDLRAQCLREQMAIRCQPI